MFARFGDLFRPDFLVQQHHAPKSAWGFWFGWAALISLVVAVVGAFAAPKLIQKGAEIAEAGIAAQYPEYKELEFTMTDGVLSTNAEEPIALRLGEEGEFLQLLIDTEGNTYTAESLQSGQGGMLVDAGQITIYQANDLGGGETQTIPFMGFSDGTISWDGLLTLAAEKQSTIMVPIALMVFAGLFFYLGLFRLFAVLIVSVVVLIISKVAQLNMDFSQSWKAVQHYMVPAMVLWFIGVGAWVGALAFFAWHAYALKNHLKAHHADGADHDANMTHNDVA